MPPAAAAPVAEAPRIEAPAGDEHAVSVPAPSPPPAEERPPFSLFAWMRRDPEGKGRNDD
jgi:hypothetical protein